MALTLQQFQPVAKSLFLNRIEKHVEEFVAVLTIKTALKLSHGNA